MLKEDIHSNNKAVFFNIDVDSLNKTVNIPNDIYVKLDLDCILKIPELRKTLSIKVNLYVDFKDNTNNNSDVKYKILPFELDIKDNEISRIILESIGDNVTDKISNNVTDKISDKVTDKIGDNVNVKIGDNVTDKISDNITDKISDNVDYKISDNVDYKIDDNVNIYMDKFNDDLEICKNKLHNSIDILEDYNREEELKKINIVMNNLHDYISNFSEKMKVNNIGDFSISNTQEEPIDTFTKYLNDIRQENINDLDYNIIKQLIYHYTLLNKNDDIINNLIELMKFVNNFNIKNILKKEYVITALNIIYKDSDKHKFIKIIENQLIDNMINIDKNKIKIKGNNKVCSII